MNTTDTACSDGPCVFDLVGDPEETLNLVRKRHLFCTILYYK
jgi:hypothetical protein